MLAAALRQVIGLITGLLMCFVGPVSSGGPVFCLPQALLFMLRQRKVSKRKASQRPCPFGVPCATRVARGQAQTRYAQTSARPDPCAAALLSTAKWRGERVLVRCAHIARACAPSLPRHCRSRAKPRAIGYDCHVPQSGPTNPYCNAPIQNP